MRKSISNNKVLDIIQPEVYDTSALWVATNNGLNRLDLKSETFTHIQESDGISSSYILKILEDNYGNLWFSTSKGLSKYNPKTGAVKNYGKKMTFQLFVLVQDDRIQLKIRMDDYILLGMV